jgi:hypothetical protein
MQNFRIIEERDTHGNFIGWSIHHGQTVHQPQIYPLYEIAETAALRQLQIARSE